MKLTALLATTSIALLGLTTTAQAQNDEGWYVRGNLGYGCLLYTSPSPRDKRQSRMPSSA